MARSSTGEHFCQSELQETVNNRSLVPVGVAFDILQCWKDVHMQTYEYSLQVKYKGQVTTTTAQLYGCSRQCSHPVLARCSMGFGPNPLMKGLIQHTFKLNILFLEKFTIIHCYKTKLLSFHHKSP